MAITVRGETYGDLCLSERVDGRPFDDEDEEVVRAPAGAAGLATDHLLADRHPGDGHDDMAVPAIRIPERADGCRQESWTGSSAPASVTPSSGARR
ncbi:hypothetical protein [Streptomyces sp. NPDC093260]|uniref:hypothetical protein n=1 Tax=Streptomyces sp. NPDC093260 TaxID=3155073 RepID=UPI003444BEB1